ncbi:MAG: hypothetical protein ACFCUE_07460 [Candidatus Bathyarchaeia archaeon]
MHLRNRQALVLVTLFFVAFTVYYVTGEGYPNHYNYYVRLADALLQGRLYLLDNPAWLNELIPLNGVYYVVYPPFPALIMTPLVAIFGLSLNQTLVSLFFGALTVSLSYILACDVRKSQNYGQNVSFSVWAAVLFGFGTIFWWISSVGSVWLIAQVFATFFMFLALHESFSKSRPLLIGLLVGASYWCRLPTILGIFFFVILILNRQPAQQWGIKIRQAMPSLVKLAVGAGVFVLLNFMYNYVRFGTLLDAGYWMIPGIQNEPWFSKGLFSLSYIYDNLVTFFSGLPTIAFDPFTIIFPLTGTAIWLTTPAFVFALKSKISNVVTVSCWVAVFAVSFVIFTKGLSGWGFGYRYALDFYPFLFVLTLKGFGKELRWYHKLLIVVGVVVNLVGTVAVNQYHLIG